MFSWVVKVVPQPPAPPGKLGDEASPSATDTDVGKKQQVKEPDPAKPKEASEENSSQSGVLSWLSHGFSTALPQPVNTSKLVNTEAKQEDNAASNSTTGMIGWIVQGLGKVVPQPDEKCKGHTEPQEITEVYEVKDLHDTEPLPHIPVVEIVSDEEPDTANTSFSPGVIEWIKQGLEKVVPQSPVHLQAPSSSDAKVLKAVSAPVTPCRQAPTPAPISTPAPAPAPAPATLEPPKVVEDSKSVSKEKEMNMVDWIVQGIGRIMPQPVLPPKEESPDVVQNICILQDTCDMMLEEVDSDWETQQKEQSSGQDVQAEEQVHQESTALLQVLPNIVPQVLAMQQQDDAETQTERWTPLIESIRKEAEETAIANLQERLQQERVEAARMAEDLARHAAELAVRQLEEEHTIQIISEPKDEEQDNENQCNVDVCPAEPSPHQSEASDQMTHSPQPPKPLKTETASPPVTTQPERVTSSPLDRDKDQETLEESCGVPASCSGVKSWALRFPYASQCLDNFSQLLKKNNVTLPKLPSLSPDLLLLYQELSQKPKQRLQNAFLRLNNLKST